jgi:hypothetical protein
MAKPLVSVDRPLLSRFIRTTDLIRAETVLALPDDSKIAPLSSDEATALADQVRKRNVFARHSQERNFYPERFAELGGHSTIQVLRNGYPDDMIDEAEAVANLVEKLATLSSTLSLYREDFQRTLGISMKATKEINVVYDDKFRYIRSKTTKAPTGKGVVLDDRFVRRFNRCGFPNLYLYCLSDVALAGRVLGSLDWLIESRREPLLTSSIVKTSIALESLLIISESESLARTLSERAAFILSPYAQVRQSISRIIKTFYEARSGVVHGNKKKQKKLTTSLVESVDRLVLLMYLVFAANAVRWSTSEDLTNWCELQRWGAPEEVEIPFPKTYLTRAIELGQ